MLVKRYLRTLQISHRLKFSLNLMTLDKLYFIEGDSLSQIQGFYQKLG